MLQRMKKQVSKQGISILVVVLICAACVLFSCQKSGFFIDELYSYGLSNGQNTPFVSYIKGNILGATYTGQDFRNYLTVDAEDAFDYASVYYNQTQDVHPPLFYILLHTVSSVFQNSFSKWIGIGLNIPFFAFTNILLYAVAKKLFRSKKIALCGVILYGFNTLAISTFLMIRMYMLLTCLTILLVYLLIKLNENHAWYQYIFVSLTVLAGLLTQYYYVFYAFFLCGFYCIWLLSKKQFKHAAFFAVSAISGVVAAYLIFPSCIAQLFNSDSAVSGASTVDNLSSLTGCLMRIITFGGGLAVKSIPLVLVAAAAIILCLCNVRNLKEQYKECAFNFEALIYILPAVLAFIAVSVMAPYTVTRYMYNIVPIFTLAVCFLLMLAKHSLKRMHVKPTAICAGILALSICFVLLIQPGPLYADYKGQKEKTEPFLDQPCIYLTENKNAAISSDLDILAEFNQIYVTGPEDVLSCSAFINSFDSYQSIIVYISSTLEDVDHDAVLKTIGEEFNLYSHKILYNRLTSTTYVLSSK